MPFRVRQLSRGTSVWSTGLSGSCVAVSALSAVLSCSSAQRPPPLSIPDETSGPLSSVILLPLTTRSTDGLLGHSWDVEADTADPLRPVLNGTVIVTGTEQHVMFFRDTAARGELDATLGLASAGVWAAHVTHVLYDVQVTALAAFAAGTQRYVADSGCCLQGNPTESCESGYVYRVMRGSGTIRLLQRLEGEASLGIKELVVARGGARYRVADESTFKDAYFGLELSPLQSVCRTLTPEQEMAPLRLLAPPNCTVQRYGALGEKEVLARQMPSQELCQNVARRYCGELSGVIACRVRFGTTDEADLMAVTNVTAAPESLPQKPATTGKPVKRVQAPLPSAAVPLKSSESPPLAGPPK